MFKTTSDSYKTFFRMLLILIMQVKSGTRQSMFLDLCLNVDFFFFKSMIWIYSTSNLYLWIDVYFSISLIFFSIICCLILQYNCKKKKSCWYCLWQTLDVSEQIYARDRGSPPRTGTCTVTVNILDINNKNPYFDPPTVSVTVSESKLMLSCHLMKTSIPFTISFVR